MEGLTVHNVRVDTTVCLPSQPETTSTASDNCPTGKAVSPTLAADNDDHSSAFHVSEHTHLLSHNQLEHHNTRGTSQRCLQLYTSTYRRTTILVLLIVLMDEIWAAMQPPIRTQIYQDVICQQYYGRHRKIKALPLLNNVSTSSIAFSALSDDCTSPAIQHELALVKGYEFLMPFPSTILLSIPYGHLADSVGRRYVLTLSLLGRFLGDLWSLAVCYWSDLFPIRAVWIKGVFQFVGGGSTVYANMVRIIITDYTEGELQTRTLLCLDVVVVLAGLLGPAAAGTILELGYPWTAAVLSEVILLSAVGLCVLLPETHTVRKPTAAAETPDPSTGTREGSDSEPEVMGSILSRFFRCSTSVFQAIRGAFAAVLRVFAENRQALILLILYSPCLFARTVFNMFGLLYFRNKFGVPYSRTFLVLSLGAAVEGATLLFLTPGLSYITSPLAGYLNWSFWKRTRRLSIISLSVLSCGHALLAVAPSTAIAVGGFVLVCLSRGAATMIFSLLGSVVSSTDRSLAYSAAGSLTHALQAGLAPIASLLLREGLNLGQHWQGLPFLFTAGLTTLALVFAFFIPTDVLPGGLREPGQQLSADL